MQLSLKYFLLLAAAPLFAVPTASATTINFNPPPTFTTPTALGTYTENGFSVTSPAGNWVENSAQGNPPAGISGGTVISDSGATSTLTLTETGNLAFFFVGFDMDAYQSAATYSVTGTKNGLTVFTASGTDNTLVSGNGQWITIDPTVAGIGNLVDSVTISVSDTNASTHYGLDNIVVATPEPSSLLLLGTGLLGFGRVVRRRFFA